MNDHIEISDARLPVGATRRRLLYAAVAAAAGLGGAGYAWWRYAAPKVSGGVDPAFWQRRFATPSGGTLAMQVLQGKPLVVNFWATWCPPCIEEMPLLDRFYRENSIKSWQVVGLAVDRLEAVQRFLAANPISFPVGLAESDGFELTQVLGNLSGGLPFTVVLGSDGMVLQRKIGRLAPADLSAWAALEGAV